MKILFNQKIVLTLILMFFFLNHSLAREIKSIRVIADTSGYWFIDGKISMGCIAYYGGGKERRTTGYLNGNLRWNNLEISCEVGTFDKGVLTIDIEKAKKNGGVVNIAAVVRGDQNIQHQLKLTIPTIRKIDVLLPDGYKPKPGTRFWPDIVCQYSNGRYLRTNPWKYPKTLSPDSLFIYQEDKLIETGLIQIPENLILAGGKVTISAVWRSNRKIHDVEVFAIHFDIINHIEFSATEGLDGNSGNPGGNDQNGYPGETGGNGGDAERVTIFMFQETDVADSVIQIYCYYNKKKYEFHLKAGIGKIEIVARGGNGGNGGDGGRGGDATSGSGGYGGYGGNGGDGGMGGKGAEIVIYCDAESEKYLPSILIDNRGGIGGEPGSGGKGGEVDSDGESKTLFDILFPSRNSRGEKGSIGPNGPDGGEATINIMSIQDIKSKWILLAD